VISQTPAAGEPATEGDAVALVISTGPCAVTVPNVVGQTQSAAGTALTGAGLTTGSVAQQCSTTVSAGFVISQNPAAGGQAVSGTPVALVISTGPCAVTVPNVVGQAQPSAVAALMGANLALGRVTPRCSSTVAAGSVISQIPAAGTQALSGDSVALVVSTGPCDLAVPNVVGQTQSAAVAAIMDANLTAGTVTTVCSNEVVSGLVVSQNPAADTQVGPGDAVALVISTGPCGVTVPNVVGQTQSAAAAALAGANLTAGTVTQACSSTVAAGLVISQTPAAGTQSAPGNAVALTVSTGLCSVTVPNVVGQMQDAASLAITNALLSVGTVAQMYSATAPAGQVVGQNPAAGTSVFTGTPVDLDVSKGQLFVTVPNVVGQTQAAAGAALTGGNLITGTVTQECSNTVAAGLVISQIPAADAQATYGDAVALTVSTGLCNVTVPGVVGETQEAAGILLEGAGLAVGAVTQQCSGTVAAGLVISQNPAAGGQATSGAAVALVISTGQCDVTVPGVVGETQEAAGVLLAGANLTVGAVTQQCSGTVAAGLVISQNPAAGQQAAFGSTVALVVSTGPCDVTVPGVAGETQEAAGILLADANLTVGAVTQQCSNTVAAGLVIGQTPAAGQQAAFGSAVALVVSTGPCSVVVPGVVGETRAAAAVLLEGANLTAGAVTEQCSNTVAAGVVISQTPAAGQQALFASAVALTVSTGPCGVTVPNVVGQTRETAGTTLTGVNLGLGTATQACSNAVAAGLVISQNPAAGAVAALGSAVTLVVSTGPCEATVPDVANLTQEVAVAALTGANLAVGAIVQACSNNVAVGLVISQDPAPGTETMIGSAVALVVSTGRCTVATPAVSGLSFGEAQAALAAAGLVHRTGKCNGAGRTDYQPGSPCRRGYRSGFNGDSGPFDGAGKHRLRLLCRHRKHRKVRP
jgi:beta-lactam-binding protein with PASTA domain